METIDIETTIRHTPEGLDRDGKKALELIRKWLEEKDLIYTGGCTPFYSPKEWKERGELYGLNSALIVVYDGGDLSFVFNLDKMVGYRLHDEITQILQENGFMIEACTCWYSAIYKDG